MRYALGGRWPEIVRRLKPLDQVLWLFDFDGTLAPIASHPAKAESPRPMRKVLQKLAHRFPGRVGVISGRAIKDLRRKVGHRSLLYSGTHGHEIDGAGWRYRHRPSRTLQDKLQRVSERLEERVNQIPGFWIEKKDWSRCFHFRQTRSIDAKRVSQVLEVAKQEARRLGLRAQLGLKSFEVLPGEARNKGTAVRQMQKKLKARKVFYVGDDNTDESVFRAFKPPHITVRVGRDVHSGAVYYVRHQREVLRLLAELERL